jgi:hypothetical protein
MRVFISHVESAHRQGQERCHEEVLPVEDLKSVEVTGCSSVERMLKSADTSLKKLEKHYPKNSTADVDRDCFISANPDWRDKNPRPSSKWVTVTGARRVMAEQRKVHQEEVKNKFVCLEDIVKMKKRLKKAANTGDLQDSLRRISCSWISSQTCRLQRSQNGDQRTVQGELRNHACRE